MPLPLDYQPSLEPDASPEDTKLLQGITGVNHVWGFTCFLLFGFPFGFSLCMLPFHGMADEPGESGLRMILFLLGLTTPGVLGVMALNDPGMFDPPAGSAVPRNPQQPPPEFLGWTFIGCGSAGLLWGWTTGILTIIAGRGLARQRRRVLSLVVAGLNCLSVPFGTLLGVFTFVVLLRPGVQALYDQRAAERAAGGMVGAPGT